MSKMTCPICGKEYEDIFFEIGENGNPICKNCKLVEEGEDNSDDE